MMPNSVHGKSILLGISGSISSYKAVDLASKLVQHGADLDVIMTSSAAQFIAPLTFESIIHKPVIQDVFTSGSEEGIYHISATVQADLVVLAPATANMIAKIANGLCDDPVSLAVLSSKAPVIVCPAMDGHMYQNPATQENIQKLTDRGIVLVGPTTGHLASGSIGQGRLVEPSDILGHIRLLLGQTGDLAGRKIVVSAGGTQEAIDPVRFLGNRSSGKMGYALAEAAIDRGANTVLIAAPNNLTNHRAILNEMEDCDILIMPAAVAAWRPKETSKNKIKKNDLENWSITLQKNEDILRSIKEADLVKVGFAAETENTLSQARQKLNEKNLNLIVANNVTETDIGFGSENNEVILIDREGNVNELGLLSKYEIGQHILNAVAPMLKPT